MPLEPVFDILRKGGHIGGVRAFKAVVDVRKAILTSLISVW